MAAEFKEREAAAADNAQLEQDPFEQLHSGLCSTGGALLCLRGRHYLPTRIPPWVAGWISIGYKDIQRNCHAPAAQKQ